jgi:hypothetical protein
MLCLCLQAELEQQGQQLADSTQREAAYSQRHTQFEQQGADLLKLQQEMEQAQQLLQQQTKTAATNKASASAAW